MPFSTIDKGSKYFTANLHTGTGASRSITGLEFAPEMVWFKGRSVAYNNHIYDIIRGTTKAVMTNLTNAETTYSDALTAFNSDGYTIGANANVNESSATYVSWNWKANGSGVSNTSGSISSTVSANTTSGFSIVSWTGNGSNSDQTLGTGLSTALDFVIAKPRDTGGGTDTWLVYASVLNMTQDQYILLNSSGALSTGAVQGTPARGSTAGQLKLFAGTTGNQNLNANGLKYIAYCFHNVKGYSKFGSYTGNGNADGTFVYTGFTPAFIMTKQTSGGGGNWFIVDNKRNTFNVVNNLLDANLSNAERNANIYDFYSNGFKDRLGLGSGETFIYMAFAESPFVSSKSIPTTAR
jgi:hypothetical protein